MKIIATESVYNARQKAIRDREWTFAEPLLRPLSPGRFLDIGCGTGYEMAKAFGLGFEAHGVDPSPGNHGVPADVPENIVARIKKGTAEQLPFPDRYFDVVFMSHTLPVVQDRKQVLQEMRRVLKPNGHAVLVLPTATMALVRLVSMYLFGTHVRLVVFWRHPSWRTFADVFWPRPFSPQLSSAFAEIQDWRIPHWRQVLSREFEVVEVAPTFFCTYPDFVPHISQLHTTHWTSSIIVVTLPRLT